MKYKLRVCSAAAAAALVLVALTPLEAGATFPGHNGRIIFHRGTTSGTFLVSMEPDGSDPTRVTSRTSSVAGVSWAPDGSRFIYSRRNKDGTIDLFLRDADGSNPTRVTDSNGDEFSVAFGPDGNQAVYSKCVSDQCDLFIIDLTTKIETRVTNDLASEFHPEWSVDDVIVFQRFPFRQQGGDYEIATIHSDGTNPTLLTRNRRQDDVGPSWSPDGTRIVYSRCNRFVTSCDLFTMNSDGSHKNRVTDTRVDEVDAQFSPNGRSFVFTRRGAKDNLFRMRTNGRRLRRLTNTPSKSEDLADWQPVP